MKPKKYLAVAMDAGQARLLTKVGRTGRWNDVREIHAGGHHHAGKSGSTYESVGSARHGVHPHSDPHRLDQKDFVRQMSVLLADTVAEEAPDAILIVAPPSVMGDLRDALTAPVAKLVTAELAKDFVKIPIADLASRLDDLAGVWPEEEPGLPAGRTTAA